MSQINNSFGSEGMSLALNEVQFSQFIQHLKDNAPSVIRAAVSRIGKHEGYPVWVMGENIQLNEDGDLIPKENRSIVWHAASLAENIGNVQLSELVPTIHIPLDSSVLTRCVCVCVCVCTTIIVVVTVEIGWKCISVI